MRAVAIALLLQFSCLCAFAAPTPPAIRAEIDMLLGKLQASNCEFNRNGSWYKADEARTHLLKKLQYLEDKTTLQSTEQFIELAATSSSMSGKSYHVRCASAAPVTSASWLATELKALRASVKK